MFCARKITPRAEYQENSEFLSSLLSFDCVITTAHMLGHATTTKRAPHMAVMEAVDSLPVANTFHLESKLNLSPAVSA